MKVSLSPLRIQVVPHLGDREDGQESAVVEKRVRLQGFTERPLAADGVVSRLFVVVDADADLQGEAGAVRDSPQPVRFRPIDENAVGQHGNREIPEGAFEYGQEGPVNEGLAAGEIDLLDPHSPGIVQIAEDAGGFHQLQGVVVRGAADETVVATQVAERAGDLKPECVQMLEGQ